MKLIYGLAILPIAALVGFRLDGAVDSHAATLQAAASFNAKFRVNTVGAGVEDQEILLARPNLIRWETPNKLVLSDGTTATIFDKKKNTYSQSPATEAWLKKTLGDDIVWAWSAFFNKDLGKQVKGAQRSSQVSVKGKSLVRYIIERENKKPITLLLDATKGIFTGGQFETNSGDALVVQSDSVILGTKKLDPSGFTFAVPAGATEVKPNDPAKELTFADVSDIVRKQCGGCHSGGAPKGGVNLSNYASIMSTGTVTAGDPDNSKFITIIRSGQMPPRRKMDTESLDKLAKWVKDGAKE